jgi:hypothetical protein
MFIYLCASMQTKKIVTSVFFLLIYLAGFSHDVVPHNHDGGNHKHLEEYHQHSEGSNGHEHDVDHNHFEESFLDLIICFFSEVEHSQVDDNIQFIVLTKRIFIGANYLQNVEANLHKDLLVSSNLKKAENFKFLGFFERLHGVPLASSCSHRGPPPAFV